MLLITESTTETQKKDWIYKVKRQSFCSLLQIYHWTIERKNSYSFSFPKNKSCIFTVKKPGQHGNQFVPTDIVNRNHRKIYHQNDNHVAHKNEIIEQLRCVAHWNLIVARTKALMSYQKRVFIEKKRAPANFACPKRLSNLSREAIINVQNARPCVMCAMFPLKIKQFR